MNEPDHIFWAKRWQAAKRIHSRQSEMMAAINLVSYLCSVFSYFADQKENKSNV